MQRLTCVYLRLSKPNNRYWLLALFADKRWPFLVNVSGNNNLKNALNHFQYAFCVAVKKPVISDSTKPLGQCMLQNKPKKHFTFDSSSLENAGTAFLVAEGDVSAVILDDVVFSNHASIQIT